jgi:hypothetical protein
MRITLAPHTLIPEIGAKQMIVFGMNTSAKIVENSGEKIDEIVYW